MMGYEPRMPPQYDQLHVTTPYVPHPYGVANPAVGMPQAGNPEFQYQPPVPSTNSSPSRQEGSRPVARRSEPSLKLPQFSGQLGEWENFEFQFDAISDIYDWSDDKKFQNLKACLTKNAISFVRTLPAEARHCYTRLRAALQQRYKVKERPDLLRKDLHDIKQRVDECIDDFADRVHNLASIAFRDSGTDVINMIGYEHFIRGIKDRQAAYEAAKAAPCSVQEALSRVKDAAALQKLCRVPQSHLGRPPEGQW